MNCDYCRAEMKLLFNWYYCPNHCDLPADKKAVAKKKDEEARAISKPNPNASGVATPVSAPVVAKCPGPCGQPENWVQGPYGTFCGNKYSFMGTIKGCYAAKPINFAAIGKSTSANTWNFKYPTFTINWGGGTIDVISDPDCPADKPYFLPNGQYTANPLLIALKKPYPDFQRDGMVPGP